jgi:ubiquinone/menaquinone biosynthesis C-methylase UbiE
MLARVLEPEVMDSAEEARDYDAMYHAGVNRSFVEDFLRLWRPAGRPSARVLDVGTGTAQIPVLLCRLASEATVVAIDYAEHMLGVARANVARARLSDRVLLERCDAKQMPFADHSFSAVVSNSIVHHIPAPLQVLREMVRALAEGGCLLVRDLLRPENDAAVQRLVAMYAGDANKHQQAMFEASLHAALTLQEAREMAQAAGLAPETVQPSSDRHWTLTVAPAP